MIIYAVIPARSNSKRLMNKNIKKLLGVPLFVHSINFARKLKFVDKIIFTSDSLNYFRLVKYKKKIIFHQRSKKSSSDKAMEQDILLDLKNYFIKKKIKFPDAILWLRPTSPLRSLDSFKKGHTLFKKNKNTVMIVHEEESRLFKKKGNFLRPILKKMIGKSMLRSQECQPLFSIFSGEYFLFPKKINKNFLGSKLNFIITTKYTKFDIDNNDDFKILDNLLKSNKKIYNKYVHI